MMRLGIDTGGTFTDFVLLSPDHGRVHKVPSDPGEPLRAIAAGLGVLCPQGLAGVEVVHGTTVGTNAFLTRQGARVALLTTQGFEDILFIGRQTRPELFSLHSSKPPDLLPRERVVGVKERLRADGSVLVGLTSDEVQQVQRRLTAMAPEAVAICLLHSYLNPAHEEQLAEALGSLKVPLSLSSRVLPEMREYERTAATVLNAYLSPVVDKYLTAWGQRFPDAPLFIQQSNGGFFPAYRATSWGLATVLSGPAGGVYGAWLLAQELGESQVLTLDMGGTSTDVALLAGSIPFTTEYVLDGYPLGLPVIDIHTVGAGGGSIARRDGGGALRVGPNSAGADPGPVCYGRGEAVTVTDAQLFLGRLLPQFFLGGRVTLAVSATERAMTQLAAAFGVTPEALALGIIRVANSHMAKALRAVSLERGYDPRDFTLFCFGGAGGLHVCELARELDIRRLIFPAHAGVLSALGMARAAYRRDLSHTLLLRGPALNWKRLTAEYEALKEAGLAELIADGVQTHGLRIAATLGMRYQGQTYTLTVPLRSTFRDDFHAQHQRLYGHALPGQELEAVTMRLHFEAPTTMGPPAVMEAVRTNPGLPLPRQHHLILPTGETATVPIYYRPALDPGAEISGPALLVEDFATFLLLPGFGGKITSQGHLVVERR